MTARYAVALILPQEVEDLLNRLRGVHCSQMTFISIPHITLGYFLTDVELTIVKRAIEQLAEMTVPCTLNLNGIEYFEGDLNTAYVAIENTEPVISLRLKISEHLQRAVGTNIGEHSDSYCYHPHVTIGTNISALAFPAIKEMLSQKGVRLEILADTLALGSIGDDGKSRIESLFKLLG